MSLIPEVSRGDSAFLAPAQAQKYPAISFERPFYSGQEDRVEELNGRIMNRCHADRPLETLYTPRSVSTKYSRFPIINLQTPSSVPISQPTAYNISEDFNPGYRAPVSGYISNIDNEIRLRTQGHLASKRDSGIYIPSSESDLYNTWIVSRPVDQPYPLLFHREKNWVDITGTFIDEFPTIGAQILNNDTRSQLRDL